MVEYTITTSMVAEYNCTVWVAHFKSEYHINVTCGAILKSIDNPNVNICYNHIPEYKRDYKCCD